MEAYFLEALQKHDIPIPKTKVTYNMTRWGKNNKYWAKAFEGGYVFGDFSRGLNESVFQDKLDPSVREARIHEIQKDIQKAQEEDQRIAAQKANAIFKASKECYEHPYLKKKHIKPFGVKIYESGLLIPIFDIDGRLISLQFVDEDGQKRYLGRAKKKGGFFSIGDLEKYDTLIICEGYATGATIYDILHKPVIVAFDSGNLKAVAIEIRKKYKDKKIIFAADNDQFSSINVGVEKAFEAAAEVQGIVVKPEFEDVDTKPTDFNDLYILEGDEKVLECFKNIRDSYSPLKDFTLNESGLFARDNRNKLMFVSDYINVLAYTQEFHSGVFGKLIEFKIRATGRMQKMKILNEWLSNNGDNLRTQLMKRGFVISISAFAKMKFNEYVNLSDPKDLLVYFEESGWKDDLFVLGREIVGKINEKSISGINDKSIKCKGSLEDWKTHVAKYCAGNSRLMFSVCSAFASILLKVCDIPNCGFNLVGESSIGKTTCLKVAASVFGKNDYINTWRTTDNALEELAMTRNDLLLILDEMGQVEASKIGEIAYMLANGQGKARLDRDCNKKEIKRWRLLFLSTGEIELSAHMSESKKTTRAGQEIRLINIPARPENADRSYGIFENLHGFENGALFADYLTEASQKYYGVAGQEFIKDVILRKEKIKNEFEMRLQELRNLHLSPQASEQDQRAFRMFALIIFAGELATKFEITGWLLPFVNLYIVSCFKDWLSHKGGFGNQEEKVMLEKVKSFFELHSQSRFQKLSVDEEKIPNMAGYKGSDRNGTLFYVFPTVFKKEICSGYDYRAVIKLLIAKNILLVDDKGHNSFQKKCYGRNTRVYIITEEVFS